MSTCRIVVAAWVFLVLAALTAPAGATTINSYSFSLTTGWLSPESFLSGSFTGTLEDTGRLNLNDLTNFSLAGSLAGLDFLGNLSSLTFFSYDTTAGVSTFTFIDQSAIPFGAVCIGAASVLSPKCNIGSLPPATRAVLRAPLALDHTANVPTLTLVSSVTTVPEPSTGALLLVGLVGLTLTTYWRATTSTAVTKP